MSLYLMYFDDGPLRQLAGNKARIFYDEGALRVTCGGDLLATRTLGICYEFSSGPFRTSFDPALHRELLLFLAERIEQGHIPHLFFHWVGSEDAVEVTGVADTKVRDAADLFDILHRLPNDSVIRITEISNPIHRSTTELIAEMLADGSIPWFDGILLGDGAIVVMEHRIDRESPDSAPLVRPLVRSTLDAYLAYNQNRWRTIEALGTSDAKPEGVQLTWGKGKDWGSDGFLAVRDVGDGSLRWVAHFQESGAFQEAKLDGGDVVAVTPDGCRWRFPLERPELVLVEK